MEEIVTHKVCTKCKKEKRFSEYGKDKRGLYGLVAQCKKCISEKGAKWNKNNKEKVRENTARFLAKHNGYRKEYLKRYYQCNKDYYRQQTRIWKNSHPIQVSVYNNNRRVKCKGLTGNVGVDEWKDILDIYGNKCLCCGRSDVKLTQDHVVPLSKGGRHVVENIQPLCKSCNSKKRTQIVDYRLMAVSK